MQFVCLSGSNVWQIFFLLLWYIYVYIVVFLHKICLFLVICISFVWELFCFFFLLLIISMNDGVDDTTMIMVILCRDNKTYWGRALVFYMCIFDECSRNKIVVKNAKLFYFIDGVAICAMNFGLNSEGMEIKLKKNSI